MKQLFQFNDALNRNVNVRRLIVNQPMPADENAYAEEAPALALSA